MYSFLTKNGQTIAFVAGVVLSILFIVLVISAPSTADLNAEYFTNIKDPVARQDALVGLTQFDFGLYITYILLAITALAAIAFGLFQFITTLMDNPKNAIRTVAIIVGLILIFFIGKTIAPETDSNGVMAAANEFGVSGGERGFVSGAINTTIIVLLLAVVVLVVSEVRNAFK
jgi:hypothetical protein